MTRAELPLIGKVILLGEHAVLYGAPAIAVPLHLPGHFTVESGGSSVRILPPLLAEHTAAVEAILNGALAGEGFTLRLPARLPAGAGLGMSAALSVALARAAALVRGEAATGDTHALARRIEEHFHGTPSGIDDTTIWYDRPVLLQRPDIQVEVPFPHERLGPHALWLTSSVPDLVVGDSGERSATKLMVERVAATLDGAGRRDFARFTSGAVQRFLGAWKASDAPSMGREMNAAQERCRLLGISTARLDSMVERALEAGAYGAKLSGSGGGGVVVALVSAATREAVVDVWRSMGCEVPSAVD